MKVSRIKDYYKLTKPGIIYGNAIAAVAGFLLASKGHFSVFLFLTTILGLSFVIASACVFNNYIDRNIDEKMLRTKKRALVIKIIPVRNALFYGALLGVIGFASLFTFTNILTTGIAFIGYFFYVVLYSIGKRQTIHGTLIGSVSGAVPPVVGYCAITNRFDLTAVLLFLILVIWQMPHSYAIGIFRLKDYASAGIPLLPVKKGIANTKMQIICYIIAFIIVSSLLAVIHATGYTYLIVTLAVNLLWLKKAIEGFKTSDNERWARKLFGFSLIALLVWSFMLCANSLLP